MIAPRRLAAYVAMLVLTGACAFGEIYANYGDPVDLHPSDVDGTWCNDSQGGRIVFESDSFTATKLPAEEFQDFLPQDFDRTSSLDGSGTWDVIGSVVNLHFTMLAGHDDSGGDELEAYSSDGVVRLFFFFVGDGGNEWYAYRKGTADCAPPPTK